MLYLQTVSIVEALVESVPQIALQVRVGFFGGHLTRWVFVLSVPLSAFCVLKAIGTFLWKYSDIRDVLASLQKQYAISFTVLRTESPAPAEVRDNPDLMKEERSGFLGRYIANLANDMEVTGQAYGSQVRERSGFGGGHTLYSYKGSAEDTLPTLPNGQPGGQ